MIDSIEEGKQCLGGAMIIAMVWYRYTTLLKSENILSPKSHKMMDHKTNTKNTSNYN